MSRRCGQTAAGRGREGEQAVSESIHSRRRRAQVRPDKHSLSPQAAGSSHPAVGWRRGQRAPSWRSCSGTQARTRRRSARSTWADQGVWACVHVRELRRACKTCHSMPCRAQRGHARQALDMRPGKHPAALGASPPCSACRLAPTGAPMPLLNPAHSTAHTPHPPASVAIVLQLFVALPVAHLAGAGGVVHVFAAQVGHRGVDLAGRGAGEGGRGWRERAERPDARQQAGGRMAMCGLLLPSPPTSHPAATPRQPTCKRSVAGKGTACAPLPAPSPRPLRTCTHSGRSPMPIPSSLICARVTRRSLRPPPPPCRLSGSAACAAPPLSYLQAGGEGATRTQGRGGEEGRRARHEGPIQPTGSWRRRGAAMQHTRDTAVCAPSPARTTAAWPLPRARPGGQSGWRCRPLLGAGAHGRGGVEVSVR